MDLFDLALYRALNKGGGGDITVEPLTVTANGQYAAPSGKAYSPVGVNVQPTLQSKTVTENGMVTPDSGYDGLSSVVVDVSGGGGDITVEPLMVTANGQYAAPTGKAYSPVGVNVQPTLQSKTVTENGMVTADAGYDGLSQVVVDVSGSGGDVEASIAVENGSLVTDGVTIATQPVITDDQIGASSSQGLSFGVDTSMIVPKVQIEFDLTLNSGNHIVLSFGGSNSSGGVYLISPTQFQFYAKTIRFNVPITLTQNVKYRVKIEFTYNKATLYVDGTQVAVGQSDYVKYSIAHIFVGDNVAMLYNQSSHGEYSNDLVDNVAIRIDA